MSTDLNLRLCPVCEAPGTYVYMTDHWVRGGPTKRVYATCSWRGCLRTGMHDSESGAAAVWNERQPEDSARAEAARLRSAAEAAIAALREWRCETCGWMIGEGHDLDPDAGPCDSCAATENAYRGLAAALTPAATGREEEGHA